MKGLVSWIQRTLAIGLAAASMGAVAQARDAVQVRLSADQPVLRGDVDVTVKVSMTNVSRHPVHLLRWQLPQADSEAALFRITHEDGRRVRYTGMVVKRAAPEAPDFVRLDPGASLEMAVELTASYDLARNGRYAIEFVGKGGHGAGAVALKSDALYLWLEGRSQTSSPATAAVPTAGGSLSFAGCKASQQSLISAAVDSAKVYSADAKAYLAAGKQGARYTTWFGAYDAGRHAKVNSNFTAIDSAFNNQAVTVDCSCRKKSVYAYVYPTRPYTIYVCGAFWTAPLTGTDSKAGTLIHEMSHFDVVAGTDDVVYGQSGAKSLALSDPASAITNADSHEYFAENTPALN